MLFRLWLLLMELFPLFFAAHHFEEKSPYNQNLINCDENPHPILKKKTTKQAILCPMFRDEEGFLSEWVGHVMSLYLLNVTKNTMHLLLLIIVVHLCHFMMLLMLLMMMIDIINVIIIDRLLSNTWI